MAATSAGARSVVDHLLESHSTSRSGILRLEQGKVRKQLVLRQGRIAFAESNVGEEHLARHLVKLGRLRRSDLAKVADRMKQGTGSEEAILAATSLDRSVVEDAARQLVVRITASMFVSPGEALRFRTHDGPVHRTMDLQLPVPPVIVESVRHAVAHRQVPPAFEVLRGTVRVEANPGDERMRLPLDSAEAWAYSALVQPVSCSELAAKIPSTGVGPEELVRRLLMLGLLCLESEAESTRDGDLRAADPVEQELVELMERFQTSDHYGVLGVVPGADFEQIRAGYHALARKYHPDRFQAGGSELRALVDQLFTRVTGAYSVLSDPVRRADYDADLGKRAASSESGRDVRTRSESESQKMAESLFRAGGAAFAKSDFEKAVAHFRECVWLQPRVAKYFYALGKAQMAVPRHRKDAEKSLLQALELQPMHAQSQLALARLYIDVNLPRRAESRLQGLLQWDPENREARALLAKLEGQQRIGV